MPRCLPRGHAADADARAGRPVAGAALPGRCGVPAAIWTFGGTARERHRSRSPRGLPRLTGYGPIPRAHRRGAATPAQPIAAHPGGRMEPRGAPTCCAESPHRHTARGRACRRICPPGVRRMPNRKAPSPRCDITATPSAELPHYPHHASGPLHLAHPWCRGPAAICFIRTAPDGQDGIPVPSAGRDRFRFRTRGEGPARLAPGRTVAKLQQHHALHRSD